MLVLWRLVVGCCIFAAACSRAPLTPARSENKPVTLTIGYPLISGQDSLNGLQQAIRQLSFEGLVTISRDGRPQPRLAESWTASADGSSLTFHLRKNAVFHDGTPVDAAAVKDSLTRTLASPERDFSPGLLDIVALDTPASDQVVVKLRRRSSFLLDDLTVAITKPGTHGKATGTGPYITGDGSEEVVMNAFRNYYRGVPLADRILWKSYPTARTSWAAMMRGEIDFLYEVSPDALEFLQVEDAIDEFSFFRSYVHGIVFNARRAIFRDARVKRALNYAVDRNQIVTQVFKGHAVAAHTPTWLEHWAYDDNLPQFSYDPARAVALFDAAGLTIASNGEGPPARLRFTCIFPTSQLWERMALIVQRNLSQVGVDVQFEALPLNEFNRRLLSGDFDAVLADLIAGNAAGRPYVFWYSTSRQNAAGYRNFEVDAAFDRLRSAADDDTTRQAFRDLQTHMLDDPPGVFLAVGQTTRAVSRRFRPVTPPGGDVFRTISEWRLSDVPRVMETN